MSCTRPLCLLLAFVSAFVFAPFVVAQEPPPAELKTVAKTEQRYVVRVPAGYAEGKWVPMLVVFGSEKGEDAARAAIADVASVVAAGFVAVAPVLDQRQGVPDLRSLFVELRREFRIDQGGMHALLLDDVADSVTLLRAHRQQFQTVTYTGASGGRPEDVKGLFERRVGATAKNQLREFFTALHAQRVLPGVAGEVSRVLDDFHDAAANGDFKRYSNILSKDAVFLGTDGSERWTGEQFLREFAGYFTNGSAWTYVPLRRAVNVEPDDTIAWFDETLDNEAYGECRGSGVMSKRDGKWVVRQYHLTVPVPNDLARDVAARIRAFQNGVAKEKDNSVTTIVVVRHAEKTDAGDDPELSDAGKRRAEALARTLRDVPIRGVYTSEYRRTAATVEAIARSHSIIPVAVPAKDVVGLAARLRDDHPGEAVLMCGHSNTLPKILGQFLPGDITIGDDEYDRLFVITVTFEGRTRLLSLRYGP